MIKILVSHYKTITWLVLLAVTLLSIFPLPELPKIPGNDKTHHLLAYAALAFPVSFVKPERYYWALIFFLLWSGCLELIQPYVNRYGEWRDLLANGTGLLLGFFIARLAAYFLMPNTSR
jgi:VanZ family protein